MAWIDQRRLVSGVASRPATTTSSLDQFSRGFSVVVAIPACNEEAYVAGCLSALAVQRDFAGEPVKQATFSVLLLANNCTDRTVKRASSFVRRVPYPLFVEEHRLSPQVANAGGARKAAMDLAAERMPGGPADRSLILTTDADSRVAPTWIAATLAAFDRGADAVAGYIDPEPVEYLALGPAFLDRGRLEDTYLKAVAELYALCDPLPYDPWPNHRVASGASLAITLSAYRAIGGLPARALGEDVALVRALDFGGFRVRHALDVSVATSCRLDGRAPGGAADTMRQRHADPDAPCDADIEPASRVLRRATWRGRLRHLHQAGQLGATSGWAAALGIGAVEAAAVAGGARNQPFAPFWDAIEARSPMLRRLAPLRPSDLRRETQRARRLIGLLRARIAPSEHPVDKPVAGVAGVPAIAELLLQ